MSTGGIAEAVRRGPGAADATAIVSEGRAWTFGALLTAAEALADGLGVSGATDGQPVNAEVTGPVAAAVVTLGCDLAGVPVVHRDPATPRPASGLTLHDGRTRTPGIADRRVAHSGLWMRAGDGVPAERWSGIPARSQIFLTSGSTGNATGVIRSPGAVLADARRVGAFLGYRPDVPVLACAPLFHVYGFNYALIAPLLSGAPMSFVSPRSVPSQLHREAHRHAARTLIALPHHYGLLATSPRAAPVAGGLRTCVSAGAPLAAGVAGRLLGRYSFTLYNCYGSSEAGAVTLKPVTGMDDAGDVGAPLPGISARIAAADGVRGELLLSSDGLAAGRMSSGGVVPLDGTGGWYRTGDLASIDPATGAIQLLGRVKTMINVAGEKVSPAEIEQVLAAHPAVLDVQVLAASDRTRGQVPVARVVVTNAAAEDLLIGWCRERLAPHQVPRRIERVAAIPRSATGKPLIRDETSSPEA